MKKKKLFSQFNDPEVEREFWMQEYTIILKHFKFVSLLAGFLFLLFAIPDYLYVFGNNDPFFQTLALRLLFFLVILFLTIKMSDKTKDYLEIHFWITFTEIVCAFIYYLIITFNAQPNLLTKSFDIILIIIVFNLMPNRWIYNVIASLITFLVLIIYSYQNHYPSNPGIVYVFIIALFVFFITYFDNKYKIEKFLFKKQLTTLKNTDCLTGIYNRFKFEEELHRILKQNVSSTGSFSLILFDIDDFKVINDTYGHLYGDQILVQLVNGIKDCIRSTDIFARWGGDEFFILLPETTKIEAIELTKRIEEKIKSLASEMIQPLTCSFGILEYTGEELMEDFIKKADALMYSAKNEGKNKLKYE